MVILLSFITGFIFCLICVYFFYIKIFIINPENAKNINSEIDLQNILNNLYNNKQNNRLYIIIPENGFRFLINKIIYKTKENELDLEIRNSDYNKKHYKDLIEYIKKSKYEYIEKFTTKTKRPKSFIVKFTDSGILCIKPIENLILTLTKLINKSEPFKLMAGYNDPIIWKNRPEYLTGLKNNAENSR